MIRKGSGNVVWRVVFRAQPDVQCCVYDLGLKTGITPNLFARNRANQC